MRVVLLAASLLSATLLGLPGCLEGGGEATLLTAKEAGERADRAAEEWADDAALVNAVGMEAGEEARAQMAALLRDGGQPGRGEDGADEPERTMLAAVAAADDDVPGDGRAALWVFNYASEEADGSYMVAVTGEGVVLEEASEGMEESLFGNRPVEGWRIDSDEGAAVAREDDGYGAAVSDPEAMALTILVQADDTPVWLFGAEVPGGEGDDEGDGPGESFVAVDAATGEPMDAQEVVTSLVGFRLRESGSFSGTLSAPADGFDGAFDVELGGHGLLVVLVAVSPPPAFPLEVTVTDPAGTAYHGTVDAGVGLESTAAIAVDAVLVGEYAVDARTDVAVVNQWEVSWCTDGEPLVPMGSRACDLVPSSRAGAETLSWPGGWLWA